MKKTISRIVSFVLTLAMFVSVFTCVGITAGAAGYDVVEIYSVGKYGRAFVGDVVDIELTLHTGGNINQAYTVEVYNERGAIVARFSDIFPSTVGTSVRSFELKTVGFKAGEYYVCARNMQGKTFGEEYYNFTLISPDKDGFENNYNYNIYRDLDYATIYTPMTIYDTPTIYLDDENSVYFAVNNLYIGKEAELQIYHNGKYDSQNELKAPAGQTWIYLTGEMCNQAYGEDGNYIAIDPKEYIGEFSFCDYLGNSYNVLKVADLYSGLEPSDQYYSNFGIAILTDSNVSNPYFKIKYGEEKYAVMNLDPTYNHKYALAQDEEGTWRVYRDGKVDNDFYGFIEYNGDHWFVSYEAGLVFETEGIYYDLSYTNSAAFIRGGKVDKSVNGFYQDDDVLYCFVNGYIDFAFNGFHEYDGQLRYFDNGVSYLDYEFIDGELEFYNGKWFITANNDGYIDVDANGLYNVGDCTIYVENGIFKDDFTGVVEQEDSYYDEENEIEVDYTRYYYVVDGIVDEDYEGLVLYNEEYRYFNEGELSYDEVVTYFPESGLYYYVCDSRLDFSYNGLAEGRDDNGEWHTYVVVNGIVDTNINGLYLVEKYDSYYECGNNWLYVNNGIVNYDYTGLHYHYGTWYFIYDGRWAQDQCTVTKYAGVLYCIDNGLIDWNFTGINYYSESWEENTPTYVEAKPYVFINGSVVNKTGLVYIDEEPDDNEEGYWIYANKGIFDEDYKGLVYYDNKWYYVEDGWVDFRSSLVYLNNTWYYINGGYIDTSATLVNYNDIWYYVNGGTVQWGAKTLVNYGGGNSWFVINNGMVDWSYNGLFSFYGVNYVITNGSIQWGNTLAYIDGIWYHVNNGTVQKGSTGLVEYAGGWYYVENSSINWSFTGLVQHSSGNWYYVVNGAIDFNYNGAVTHVDGNDYNVVNGLVVF